MKKVLFLQSKRHFNSLSLNSLDLDCTFGLIFSFNFAKELLSYDLVVSCMIHDSTAQDILKKAASLNIPTALVMDGVYSESNYNNNSLAKLGGLNIEAIKVIRYVYYIGSSFPSDLIGNNTTLIEYLPSRAKLDEVIIDNKTTVLITTAMTAYFDNFERSILISWITVLVNSLIKYDIDFKFRFFDKGLIEEIEGNFGGKFSNNIENSLSHDVRSSDVTICTPSTIIHTLDCYGLKNVCLNFRKEKLFFNTLEDVCDIESIESMVRNIAHNGLKSNFKEKKHIKEELNFSEIEISRSKVICNEKLDIRFFPKTLLRFVFDTFPKNTRKKVKKTFISFLSLMVK